jgi:hypothetical protein
MFRRYSGYAKVSPGVFTVTGSVPLLGLSPGAGVTADLCVVREVCAPGLGGVVVVRGGVLTGSGFGGGVFTAGVRAGGVLVRDTAGVGVGVGGAVATGAVGAEVGAGAATSSTA